MSNNVIIYLNQKIFIWGESLFHQVLLVSFVKNIHLLAFQIIQIEHALIQTANATNVKVNVALPVEKNGSGREILIQVTWAIGTPKSIVRLVSKRRKMRELVFAHHIHSQKSPLIPRMRALH
jgi:hypothetical protein